jgi:hypothetical protein
MQIVRTMLLAFAVATLGGCACSTGPGWPGAWPSAWPTTVIPAEPTEVGELWC